MNRHYNLPTKNPSFYSCCPLQPKIINSVDRLGECRSSVQYWILGYKRWLLRWPAILLPGWGCIIGFKGGFLSYQALSSHFKFLEAHSPIYSINFPLLRTWIKLPLPEPTKSSNSCTYDLKASIRNSKEYMKEPHSTSSVKSLLNNSMITSTLIKKIEC